MRHFSEIFQPPTSFGFKLGTIPIVEGEDKLCGGGDKNRLEREREGKREKRNSRTLVRANRC